MYNSFFFFGTLRLRLVKFLQVLVAPNMVSFVYVVVTINLGLSTAIAMS